MFKDVRDWYDGKTVSLLGFVLVSLQEAAQRGGGLLGFWKDVWVCLPVEPVWGRRVDKCESGLRVGCRGAVQTEKGLGQKGKRQAHSLAR